MFGKQCWCETGQSVSEKGEVSLAPTDIGDSLLVSALEFGGLWNGGCQEGWIKGD